jgi:5'-3' exonuclease
MIPTEYKLSNMNVTRDRMMAIAQLTGSDYCPGVKNVGPKTAEKILEEFDSKGSNTLTDFQILTDFGKWWRMHHSSLTTGTAGSKFRMKLKKLVIDGDFPSFQAQNAYLNPEVEDLEKKSFRFSVPDHSQGFIIFKYKPIELYFNVRL